MENQLTRDLGVQWVPRADGHGREIKGVSQALMDEFSSGPGRHRGGAGRAGGGVPGGVRSRPGRGAGAVQARPPAARDAKPEEDPTEQVREWAQRAAQAGTALEPLAAQVCGQARLRRELTEAQAALIARAIKGLQARSTFTQSDLTRAIAEQLPAASRAGARGRRASCPL